MIAINITDDMRAQLIALAGKNDQTVRCGVIHILFAAEAARLKIRETEAFRLWAIGEVPEQ